MARTFTLFDLDMLYLRTVAYVDLHDCKATSNADGKEAGMIVGPAERTRFLADQAEIKQAFPVVQNFRAAMKKIVKEAAPHRFEKAFEMQVQVKTMFRKWVEPWEGACAHYATTTLKRSLSNALAQVDRNASLYQLNVEQFAIVPAISQEKLLAFKRISEQANPDAIRVELATPHAHERRRNQVESLTPTINDQQ